MLVAIAALVACKTGDQAKPKCDGREDQRRSWIVTVAEEYRGTSPQQRGFSVLGRCAEKIADRQLSCAETDVRGISGDSPYLRRAAELGFTTYVCELPNGQGERVEYPIARIIGGSTR